MGLFTFSDGRSERNLLNVIQQMNTTAFRLHAYPKDQYIYNI